VKRRGCLGLGPVFFSFLNGRFPSPATNPAHPIRAFVPGAMTPNLWLEDGRSWEVGGG